MEKQLDKASVRTEAGTLEVSIDREKRRILVDMPMERNPRNTKSNEHVQLATTHGNATTPIEVDGEPVILNLNIFTPTKR